MPTRKRTALWVLSSYLLLRMVADPFWRSISEYYSYLFEIIFVLIAYLLLQKQFTFWKKIDKRDISYASLALVAGVLVFKTAGFIKIIVPFDFKSYETIFFLLIVAPILEELLFRMALWEALKSLYEKKWFLILSTTILFSIGHLAAYWFIPPEFKSFVLYQSFYVIVLSIALGWQRLKTNSISVPILVHFAFNLGFFLGTKLA